MKKMLAQSKFYAVCPPAAGRVRLQEAAQCDTPSQIISNICGCLCLQLPEGAQRRAVGNVALCRRSTEEAVVVGKQFWCSFMTPPQSLRPGATYSCFSLEQVVPIM